MQASKQEQRREIQSMFFAKYKDASGEIKSRLYFNCEDYYRDTFNPECEEIAVINFKVSGYGYRKKKDAARNIAIAWTNTTDVSGLSWLDCQHVSDWFYTMGKRFGLLSEFSENGLC